MRLVCLCLLVLISYFTFCCLGMIRLFCALGLVRLFVYFGFGCFTFGLVFMLVCFGLFVCL